MAFGWNPTKSIKLVWWKFDKIDPIFFKIRQFSAQFHYSLFSAIFVNSCLPFHFPWIISGSNICHSCVKFTKLLEPCFNTLVWPYPIQYTTHSCITDLHTWYPHTYTYIYIHTHTYTYIHIHTHTYTYIHIHTYTYTYMYIRTHNHGEGKSQAW